MKPRVMLFGLLVLLSTQAVADDAELRRLQSILATFNQELTATYQQFQMVEQARRAVLQSLDAPRPGLDPRSYDQVAEDRAQAVLQEKALTEQMNRLLAKAQEIENQMHPVLDRVYQLIPAPGATQTAPPLTPQESTKPFTLPQTSPPPE
jgi:sulfite reductase alpha subunit-like flavoprotein